ncbi:transposase [Sorangium sp. So ce542]|uniref:transposase n=1 Tax=Sorangium sp. So ce542 TaxID=3133316 RepID=UPI003F625604
MGACTHESRWYSLHWRRWIRVEEGAQVPDGCLSGRKKLERWTEWGLHSQLAPFAKAAKTIRKHLDGIDAYIASGLTNARSEGMSGKARTITRRSYGFHSASSLIVKLFLCCSGIMLEPVRRFPCTH